nr:uncharacterized protein LOC110087559 isoform X2 [Pogona vitticeps]
MRFLHRVFILAFLGFIFLLWWGHLLWRNQDNLSIMDKGVDLPPMFDMLLHIQQLRKKRLRSFCSKTGVALWQTAGTLQAKPPPKHECTNLSQTRHGHGQKRGPKRGNAIPECPCAN